MPQNLVTWVASLLFHSIMQGVLNSTLPRLCLRSGKLYFIYNKPPVERYSEELQKLFKLLSTMFIAHLTSPKHWFCKWRSVCWNISIGSTFYNTLCISVFFHFCRHDTTRRSEVRIRKPSGRQQAKQEGMIERHCYQWHLLLGKWMSHHSHIWIGYLCFVALQ